MSVSPIPGFLTKKEVEELYGRSHRSLTRDFSSAVRVSDREVLTHLKVRTDDGTIRGGTEVTLEQIQELSNNGLTPTWYVEGAWAERRYGTRAEPLEKTPAHESTKSHRANTDAPMILSDESELVRRLEDQITDLQRDKEQLYNELSIKNEQIKQANERTRESNVLMKELQTLLGDVQQRALLPLPKVQDSHDKSAASRTEVIDGYQERSATKQSEPAVAKQRRPQSARTNKRKKNSGTEPQATKAAEFVPEKSAKAKWYEMPTLSRLISRRK